MNTANGPDDEPTPEEATEEITTAFRAHDLKLLATLDCEQLTTQLDARGELLHHIQQLWTEIKQHHVDPALHPEGDVIAALREIFLQLHFSALEESLRRD
jgi:hypothetical protein